MSMLSFFLSSILIVSSSTGMEQTLLVQDSYATSSLSAILSEVLQSQGFPHELIAPERLVSHLSDAALLIVPSVDRFPAELERPLIEFIRSGGRLIALGGPPFSQPTWRQQDTWLTEVEILQDARATRPLIELAEEGLSNWQYAASKDMGTAFQIGPVQDGPTSHALLLHVPRFDGRGWANLSRQIESPPPEEHNALGFWARGDAETTALVVELQEQDGSRWLTSVPLTTQWKYHTLPLRQFRFWRDASPPDRGELDDQVHPENLAILRIGLATSHAPLAAGEHRIWVGNIGTLTLPMGVDPPSPPLLEAFSPPYKLYRTEGRSISPSRWGHPFCTDLVEDPERAIPWEGNLAVTSPIWRSRGLGPTRAASRWIPLIEVRGAGSEYRGVLASVYFDGSSPGRWAFIGLGTDEIRTNREFIGQLLGQIGSILNHPLSLTRAGTSQFCYFTDERQVLVVSVANRGDVSQEILIQYRIWHAGTLVDRGTRQATVPPDEMVLISGNLALQPAGEYEVEITLHSQGNLLDRIRQPFTVREQPGDSRSAFVQVHDGRFTLKGQLWKPHGVNFWPRYVTGQEPESYWVGWLHPSHYDPVVVEWDLALLERMGVNSVSIQYTAPEFAPALADFLYRARRHGILSNIYLDGAHPLHPRPERLKHLIEKARLGKEASAWAFDLAWEPVVGDANARRRLDEAWDAWVLEQYGDREWALQIWEGQANRDAEGHFLGPTDEQILTDGPWRIMVAAYRRFLDDRISGGYNRVRQVIRELAPYTLLGARTGYGGTGQPGVDRRMPFDLLSGAKHLDFISPEGWGLRGEWETFEAAGFTTAYARYAGNGKPVFWSEFGLHLYPHYSDTLFEAQRQTYAHMYRMIHESGADGSAAWWYPGGLRVDEGSDYGLINPDGTPRPAFLELQQASNQPIEYAEPQEKIYAWRDRHPRGYSAMWERHRSEYVQMTRSGKRVEVMTPQTGKQTLSLWRVPVGRPVALKGVPIDARYPTTGLNGEWNWMEVSPDGEHWQQVLPETTLSWNGPLYLRASAGNTGDVEWSPGDEPKSVRAALWSDDRLIAYCSLTQPVRRYEDTSFDFGHVLDEDEDTLTLELRLEVIAWGPFGSRCRLTKSSVGSSSKATRPGD